MFRQIIFYSNNHKILFKQPLNYLHISCIFHANSLTCMMICSLIWTRSGMLVLVWRTMAAPWSFSLGENVPSTNWQRRQKFSVFPRGLHFNSNNFGLLEGPQTQKLTGTNLVETLIHIMIQYFCNTIRFGNF